MFTSTSLRQGKVRRLGWILMLYLLLAAFASPVSAQFDTGQLSGFVRDQHNAVITGATVKVIDTLTGHVETFVTDENGYYTVTNLKPGKYELSVEKAGFQRFVQTGINVDAASKVRIDAALNPGDITESVTVVADTAELQRDSAQIAKTIEARDIQDLAINGRNPINLPMLSPGVRSGNAFNRFQPDDLTTGSLNINGGRSDENLITVDGVIATRTRSSGAIVGALNVDTVQEVRVLTSNFLPEYGRASGGQIRFVTKSGGRDFHGGAFEFFRNAALDANTWSRNASNIPDQQRKPAPFTFNQFGYDIGGPIYIPGKFNKERDKLFFFISQEFIRWRRFGTSVSTVPTLKMRQGDFSELLGPNQFFSGPRIIKDPLTGQPFPGNIIRPDRLSAQGLALLKTFPAPTVGFQRGSNNWIADSPNPRDTRKDTLRIDYNLNSKNQLSFRGSMFSWVAVDDFRGPFPLARTDWSRPNRTAALSLTSTISPTLINEFTFGASADIVHINVFNNGLYQRSKYGISYPYIFPGTKGIEDKIPTISISGGFGTVDGGPYPAYSAGPIYSWSDNVTKIKGRHTYKAGIFVEYSGENDLDQINVQALPGDTNNQNGRFEFTDGRSGGTGLAVANAALGLFTNYGEIGTKSYTPWRAWATDLFFQDTWKLNNKLTLEYGTRYSYWPPWYSLWNNIAMFDPAFYDPSNAAVIDPKGGFITGGDRFNGIVLPGSGFPASAKGRVDAASDPQFQRLFHGLPRGFSKTRKNVFEPRLGAAYSLNSRTVIRAGAGVFHNRVTLNDSTLLGGNPPIQFKVGVTNGLVDAPAGAIRRDFPFVITMQDLEFKPPTAYEYNLILQRELPASMSLEVGYVGRVGAYLQRERNINQLLPGTRQANPNINPDALRQYKGFGVIRLSENAGHSSYNGLQVGLRRRFTKGLGFGLAYTFSKVIDNASDKRDRLFNAYDDHGFRSVSNFDRAHIFNVHYIYELPFWRSQNTLLKKVVGGWQVSGVTYFVTGAPLTVCRGDDIAGVGDTECQPWNLAGDINVPNPSFSNGIKVDQNLWFNPSAFVRPASGRFGNAGRNIIRGPSQQSWDIALFKNFPVTENTKVQFRSEFFNFPNHPNLNNPNTDPTSSEFGRILGKTGERNIQFALKFLF